MQNVRFMKNAQAAVLLGVDVRTIRRWLRNPALREALGAVVSNTGKKYRILLPDDPNAWAARARHRLNALGRHLKEPLERELERVCREQGPILVETGRLYLAAWLKALQKAAEVEPIPITQATKDRILQLWLLANSRLAQCDSATGKTPIERDLRRRLADLKSELPERLLPYWPGEEHFQQVWAADKAKDLEAIRLRIDFTVGVLRARQTEKKEAAHSTAKHLFPLLHRDITHQINDTGEDLAHNYFEQTGKEPPPGFILKAPTTVELRKISKRDWLTQRAMPRQIRKGRDAQGKVFAQIEMFPGQPAFVDIREPQEGIPLRTFRRWFPRKQKPWSEILRAIYGVSSLAELKSGFRHNGLRRLDPGVQ
jgi:hypothetical protein